MDSAGGRGCREVGSWYFAGRRGSACSSAAVSKSGRCDCGFALGGSSGLRHGRRRCHPSGRRSSSSFSSDFGWTVRVSRSACCLWPGGTCSGPCRHRLGRARSWRRRGLRRCRRRTLRGRGNWDGTWRRRFGRLALAQQSAGYAQRSLRLFDIDGFCQDQVGADAERLGNARLPFHDCNRQRRLVGG